MDSWKPSLITLISAKEGADVLTGGRRKVLGGDLQEGYYLEPTILSGKTICAFSEEILDRCWP